MKFTMRGWTIAVALAALFSWTARATAQDQVVVGARGTPGAPPGLVVLAGPGLDSVRAIVQRDLMNSDRFTVAVLGDSAGRLRVPLDPNSLKNLSITWAVELQPAVNGVDVKLYDVATGVARQQGTRALDIRGVGDTRITIHRVSDEIVKWTGGTGIAATRIAFKMSTGTDDAIWRIDSDGANLVRITRAGIFMTPAWSPDGSAVAYSEHRDSRWTLFLQKLGTGTRTAVTSSAPGDSYGGNFSPDGRSMVYSHALTSGGTAIESVDITRNCCAHTLTVDRRNADNEAASYSPDGRHIAYISNRTGTNQVWVMDQDGTTPEQLVGTQFRDEGRALDANSPAWSPDGTRIAFARDVDHGVRQIFTASVSGGQVVPRTSVGQNEDPSWAPDSRHLVFKSKRTGREQLWILDIETGNFRQLANTPGDARYPAWSHSLGTNP